MTLDKASFDKIVAVIENHYVGGVAVDGPGWIFGPNGIGRVPGWKPGPWNAMTGILGLTENLEDRELAGKIADLVSQAIRKTVMDAVGSGMTRTA